MADIGIKKNIQNAIIAALLQSPLVELLNTTSGDGVYATERIEGRDSLFPASGPCVIVNMPVASSHQSVGPATTRATMSTELYLFFSNQSDVEADESCSLITSAIRVCLANAGRNADLAKVGGYSNCFEVDDIGWGELGQDKVFALEASFLATWPSKEMVTTD